ncbi:hypothetical protein L6R53_03305 [Myxococcota bacterium]|nr:hypothetical protein [Myxococcota bacterium]
MKPWHPLALLLLASLGLRLLAAWALGEGAPFGPDGTGVQAAVHLPGHAYPGHVLLVRLLDQARTVSLLSGALTSALLWAWGRRLGLGGAGGWLHATLPVAVLTGALAGGDAPALCVVAAGALLATAPGWVLPALGGALAVASLTVKPSAAPALVLLLATPRALLGAGLALPLVAPWLSPLLRPMPGGGLLGTWWLASGGRPPASLADGAAWLLGGARALLAAPAWASAWLLPLALAAWPRLRLVAPGPLLAGLAVACLLGERLEPRYLQAAVVAALPLIGARLPGRRAWLALLFLPLSAALVGQLAAERARRDPEARVPALPVLPWPQVGAAALFEQCSTDGATALRRVAGELAATLPPGATVQVVRRRDGREGELTWPLRVARPDVVIVPVPEGTPGAW